MRKVSRVAPEACLATPPGRRDSGDCSGECRRAATGRARRRGGSGHARRATPSSAPTVWPATTSACGRRASCSRTATSRNVGADAETWEKVARKLRSGAMPPSPSARRPRSGDARRVRRGGWRPSSTARRPSIRSPACIADHRLNRFEYGQRGARPARPRDSMPRRLLPADESDHGFDTTSPTCSSMSADDSLAATCSRPRRISTARSVGDPAIGPAGGDVFNPLARACGRTKRMHEDLPYGTAGRGAHSATTSHARRRLRGEDLRLGRRTFTKLAHPGHLDNARGDRRAPRRGHRLAVHDRRGVRRLPTTRIAPGPASTARRRTNLTADDALEVRFSASAGMHDLGVVFVRKSSADGRAGADAAAAPRATPAPPTRRRGWTSTTSAWKGPLRPDRAPARQPASRRRIFVCRPGRRGRRRALREAHSRRPRPPRLPPAGGGLPTSTRCFAFYRSGAGSRSGFERERSGSAGSGLLVSPLVPVPHRARLSGEHPGGRRTTPSSDLDLLASRPVLLPLEQHPGRRACSTPRLRGTLREIRACSRRRSGECWPTGGAAAPSRGTSAASGSTFGTCGRSTPDASAYPEFDDNLREAFARRDGALPREPDARRPTAGRAADGALHVPERTPGAVLRRPERLRGALLRRTPMTDSNRAGLLGHGEHPDRHLVRDPDLRRWCARQVPAGQHSRRTAPAPRPRNVPPLEEAAGGEEPALHDAN